MVNALRWFATFLEKRFPEKVDPATYATKAQVQGQYDLFTSLNSHRQHEIKELMDKVEKMEKHIEILNLRVGLSRSTQATFGRKVNG